MRKLSFLMLLIMVMGFSVSCDRGRDMGDNDLQREEAPLREVGDEIEDGAEDVGDKAEDIGDEMD